MTHAEIVATYSDKSLAGIVRDLAAARGEWEQQRYRAAKAELQTRISQDQNQSNISKS